MSSVFVLVLGSFAPPSVFGVFVPIPGLFVLPFLSAVPVFVPVPKSFSHLFLHSLPYKHQRLF